VPGETERSVAHPLLFAIHRKRMVNTNVNMSLRPLSGEELGLEALHAPVQTLARLND